MNIKIVHIATHSENKYMHSVVQVLPVRAYMNTCEQLLYVCAYSTRLDEKKLHHNFKQ